MSKKIIEKIQDTQDFIRNGSVNKFEELLNNIKSNNLTYNKKEVDYFQISLIHLDTKLRRCIDKIENISKAKSDYAKFSKSEKKIVKKAIKIAKLLKKFSIATIQVGEVKTNTNEICYDKRMLFFGSTPTQALKNAQACCGNSAIVLSTKKLTCNYSDSQEKYEIQVMCQ